MQQPYLVFGAHQMVDNVRARCVAATIAEPAFADVAHDHTARIVDATVLAGMGRQFLSDLVQDNNTMVKRNLEHL